MYLDCNNLNISNKREKVVFLVLYYNLQMQIQTTTYPHSIPLMNPLLPLPLNSSQIFSTARCTEYPRAHNPRL